jgi:dienelactone hydrolase
MPAYSVRGNVYMGQGKLDLAQQDFRKVLQIPVTEDAHRRLQDHASAALKRIAQSKLILPKVKDPDPDPAHNETIVRLPLSVKLPSGATHKGEFVLTTFKPNGPGPFPAVIVSHGHDGLLRTQMGRNRMLAPELVRKGFAVLAPTRIGHGVSAIPEDPELPRGDRGCDGWNFAPAGEAGSAHIRATVAFAGTQPWIDKDKLVLLGQSAGGFDSLVAAGTRPRGVKAVVNFAGGRGGQVTRPEKPCNPDHVAALLSAAGKRNPIPTIWFYAENDKIFGPSVPRQWHAAYVKAGGKAEFHMFPPLGADGHAIVVTGKSHWMPLLDQFLAANALKPR